MTATRGILQLDFDGSAVVGDVSTSILARFVDPVWKDRVEAASAALRHEPDSTLLLDTMSAGFAGLHGEWDAYLEHARAHHPAREGLRELIDACEALAIECHIVSGGFEFYIEAYLRETGVLGRVPVHAGRSLNGAGLVYLGPEGEPAHSDYKQRWARHFLSRAPLLVYVGDGSSDIAAAARAHIVFARDSLLSGMPRDYAGELRSFDTLLDVAAGLR